MGLCMNKYRIYPPLCSMCCSTYLDNDASGKTLLNQMLGNFFKSSGLQKRPVLSNWMTSDCSP
eukprot:755368-Karenia_brevis.AAC.1